MRFERENKKLLVGKIVLVGQTICSDEFFRKICTL